MLKKLTFMLVAMLVCGATATQAQLKLGKINATKAIKAVSDAATAVTLSDADIACRSHERKG